MKRERTWILAALALGLLGGGPISAQLIYTLPAPISPPTSELEIAPVVKSRASVVASDGTAFDAGHRRGSQLACAATRASIDHLGVGRSLIWRRAAKKALGACFARGGPLLSGLSSLDPAYVVSSSVRDIALDEASGNVAALVDVVLAWQDAGLVTARGALVLVLGADGARLHDAYIGPPPVGAPAAGTCAAICDALGVWAEEEYTGGGVAFAPGGEVVVTGSHSWTSPSGGEQDAFVTSFAAQLAGPQWWNEFGGGCGSEGQGVAVAASGEVFVTGSTEGDLFVARFSSAGALEEQLIGGGSGEDAGSDIAVEANGDIVVGGAIVDQAVVAGQTVGAAGAGEQELTLVLSRALTVLGNGAQVIPPFLVGGTELMPVSVTAVQGESSGQVQNLYYSDDIFLGLSEGEVAADVAELRVQYQPPAAPATLKTIRVEMESEFCYTATVSVGDAVTDIFEDIGQVDVCPADEVTLSAEVPPAIAAAYGYDGVAAPDPDGRMVVRLLVEFEASVGTGNPCILTSEATQEGSVDTMEVEVEY